MSLHVDDHNISEIYHGANKIKEVYYGPDLVWQGGDEIQRMGPANYYRLNGDSKPSTGNMALQNRGNRATYTPDHMVLGTTDVDQYQFFNPVKPMTPGDSFTMAGWFNPTALTNTPVFLSRGSDSLSIDVGYYNRDREIFVAAWSGATPQWGYEYFAGRMYTDRWQHIAARFTLTSSSSTSFQVWLNGSSIAQSTIDRGVPEADLSSTYLGGSTPNHFAGGVDTVVLFERALTTAEAQQLYAIGRL